MGKINFKNVLAIAETAMMIFVGSNATAEVNPTNVNGNNTNETAIVTSVDADNNIARENCTTEIDYTKELIGDFDDFIRMLNIEQEGSLSSQDFTKAFMQMNSIKYNEEFNAALNVKHNKPVTPEMFTDCGAMCDDSLDAEVLGELRDGMAKLYENARVKGAFDLFTDESYIKVSNILTSGIDSLTVGGSWAAGNIYIGHMNEFLRFYMDMFAPKAKKNEYFNIQDGRYEDKGKRPDDDCQNYWDAVIGRYFFWQDQLKVVERTTMEYMKSGCECECASRDYHN